MKTKRGFTLIELLVVTGILIVLASLLIPAVAKARRQAHRVECMNHLGQIGKGLLMYAMDYDGRIPPGGCAGPGAPPCYVEAGGNIWYCCGHGIGLGALYDRYLPDLRCLFCPEANIYTADNESYGSAAWGTGPVVGSYRYREMAEGMRVQLQRNGHKAVVCDFNSFGADIENHRRDGISVLRADGSADWFTGEIDTSTDAIWLELDGM